MLLVFFKQKTAYEMRISDWSSDVCSSRSVGPIERGERGLDQHRRPPAGAGTRQGGERARQRSERGAAKRQDRTARAERARDRRGADAAGDGRKIARQPQRRSEEHTSELQSLMRNSYAVFCLKKKKHENKETQTTHSNITTRE